MNDIAISHRINQRLQDYWESVRGEKRIPNESDIVSEDLADIWEHCFLIDVKNSGFEYDYLGSSIIDAYGDDLRGREICETLVYPHPPSLLKTFRSVVNTAKPVIDESQFKNNKGQQIRYRSCVLPLGKVGQVGVQFLLGGMKWKAY
jgi:hypothetical protein